MTTEKEIQALTDEFVTVPVAADILKVAQPTIYRWIDQGILEGVRISKPNSRKPTCRVKLSSIRSVLGVDKQTVVPASTAD